MTKTKGSPLVKVHELFDVRSGDYHALKELDVGGIPLISCGDTDNGTVGYFDIPKDNVYEKAITVAYNGQPLTVKYHPYKFGAKDDVAVLVPLSVMRETTLLYVAAMLNRSAWRYHYGRKCFKEKLKNLTFSIPGTREIEHYAIDEQAIAALFPKEFSSFIPHKSGAGVSKVKKLNWTSFNITDVLHLERGDFHSITALSEGQFITVSRVTGDNGVVGYYERPDDAHLYSRGHITVSTVGGDAFVQLDDFIATDNVIVCTPKLPLRLATLFFIAYAINRQKWRYGYGRQCYVGKLERVNIYLPVKGKYIDEDGIEAIVKQASYWPNIESRFTGNPIFDNLPEKTLRRLAEQRRLPL